MDIRSVHTAGGPSALDSAHVFCPACYIVGPHCTQCGIIGRDAAYILFGEGSQAQRDRGPGVWPCCQGCSLLICSYCGTTRDGCHIQGYLRDCTAWNRRWSPRRFCGKLAKCATLTGTTHNTYAEATPYAATVGVLQNGLQAEVAAAIQQPQATLPRKDRRYPAANRGGHTIRRHRARGGRG